MRQAITSQSAATVGPYSHAVEVGGVVYCSGQTPVDPATGRLVVGGIGEQTRQCFANLFGVLDAAGLGPDDVVKVNVYLTHMHDFEAMSESQRPQRGMPTFSLSTASRTKPNSMRTTSTVARGSLNARSQARCGG